MLYLTFYHVKLTLQLTYENNIRIIVMMIMKLKTKQYCVLQERLNVK